MGMQVVCPESRRLVQLSHFAAREAGGWAWPWLAAPEVKSCWREGQSQLREALRRGARQQRFWLVNCHIPQYLPGGPFNHEPLSRRRLLLHRLEIERLTRQDRG